MSRLQERSSDIAVDADSSGLYNTIDLSLYQQLPMIRMSPHTNLRYPRSREHRRLDLTSSSSSSSASVPNDAKNVQHGRPPAHLISHGCVLIPVFIVAWYYYTRRACRKLARGFLKHHAEPHDDSSSHADFHRFEEAYYSPQYRRDETESNSRGGSTPSDRFVKWINRRNVRKQFQRHEIMKTTSQCLYGSPQSSRAQAQATKIAEKDNTSPTKSLMDTHDDGTDDYDSYDGGSEYWRQSSKQFDGWECIPNVSQIELCVVPSPTDDNLAYPTSYKVQFVASMDEYGVETTIHQRANLTGSREVADVP